MTSDGERLILAELTVENIRITISYITNAPMNLLQIVTTTSEYYTTQFTYYYSFGAHTRIDQ